jgi:hypothetical protein
MNKVLALDPKAIEFDSDWVKIYPFVGHEKGLFMANFPKNWTKEFLNEVYEEEKWEFWDAENSYWRAGVGSHCETEGCPGR